MLHYIKVQDICKDRI